MQLVSHALFLGVHVKFVVGIGLDFDRNVLDDFQTVAFQPDAFDRVVCHQTHFTDADLCLLYTSPSPRDTR